MPKDEPSGYDLIDAFFDALQLRNLVQCRARLQSLEVISCHEPDFKPWCGYLKGILVFVADQD